MLEHKNAPLNQSSTAVFDIFSSPGINLPPHFISLILIDLFLLIRFFMHASTHRFHAYHSYHPSLRQPFTPRLQRTFPQILLVLATRRIAFTDYFTVDRFLDPLFLLFFLVLSDFSFPKALSFLNRS